jgi:restriction system protein
METHFKLSEAERQARIPSGVATFVRHRVGWAMTDLKFAGLIEKVRPKTYRATPAATPFLARVEGPISIKDLESLQAFRDWKSGFGKKDETATAEQLPETTTPLESIDDALGSLEADLRAQLMDAILKQSPTFFESLVLDVLLAMGYGGSKAEAARHLGQSGDEGIDGCINQDALGLDQVMVQAKRYAPDRPIDRKTIQAFVGSLAGQGVTKGVFITTSTFAGSAEDYVKRGSNTKVVLIDGQALLGLMLRHEIGVRAERSFKLLAVDQNYFEDED